MMKKALKWIAIGLVGLIVVSVIIDAAGGGEDDTAATPPPATTAPQQPTVTTRPADSPAEAYALEKSGGRRTGCSSARPGIDSETNEGCIYAAALVGCAAAHDGEPDPSKVPPREGDFTEPGLIAIMARAYKDCS